MTVPTAIWVICSCCGLFSIDAIAERQACNYGSIVTSLLGGCANAPVVSIVGAISVSMTIVAVTANLTLVSFSFRLTSNTCQGAYLVFTSFRP